MGDGSHVFVNSMKIRVSSRIFCFGGEELLGILDHTHFCRYFVLACY